MLFKPPLSLQTSCHLDNGNRWIGRWMISSSISPGSSVNSYFTYLDPLSVGKLRVITLYGLNACVPPPNSCVERGPPASWCQEVGPLDGVSALAGGAPESQCHLFLPRVEVAAQKGPSADPKSAGTLFGGCGVWVRGDQPLSSWSASELSRPRPGSPR